MAPRSAVRLQCAAFALVVLLQVFTASASGVSSPNKRIHTRPNPTEVHSSSYPAPRREQRWTQPAAGAALHLPLRHWRLSGPIQNRKSDSSGHEYEYEYEYDNGSDESMSSVEVEVPSTVLGGLLTAQASGFTFDPFYAKNLDRIDPAPFAAGPWRYDTTFMLPGSLLSHRTGLGEENTDESVGRSDASTSPPPLPPPASTAASATSVTLLQLEGVNYKADVWVDGKLVATKRDVVGTFRHFTLDVSKALSHEQHGLHSLRVEIWQPRDFTFPPDNNSTDLALSFVDWAPHPPDFSMGLYRPASIVVLPAEMPLTAEGVVVNTELVGGSTDHARLTLSFVVKNWGANDAINCTFWADVGLPGVAPFQKQVATLASGQSRRIEFTARDFPAFDVTAPKLWWPWQMGKQTLFTAHVGVISSSSASVVSLAECRYGIREMSSKLTSAGYRQYFVNGLPLLIRAGGWAPDLFLRTDSQNLRDQFSLVRDMGLNAIRLEGKMESDEFFDLADEHGILTMPGWCCCDAWQHWKDWSAETKQVAQESMRTQARRLGSHPSVLVFLYSSDELPPPEIEKLYLDVFAEERWPNPTLASASKLVSPITGPTGVKMSGPYSWVPPVYWLEDKHLFGGAYGFLTEGGPGESPMTISSMSRTLPEEHLWGINGSLSTWWSYHCANPVGLFRNLRFFTPPLEARFGPGRSAADYLYKSQAMALEGIRAMYEGYSRNKHQNATGVVQWMLNNAWPENVWHLYDSYLAAGGGYYGAKTANEPLHVMMSYTDGSVWIVNSLFTPVDEHIPIVAELFSFDGTIEWSLNATVLTIDADEVLAVQGMTVPLDGAGKFTPKETFFVRLRWLDRHRPSDQQERSNVYWLSPTVDVLDWAETNFYRTPCSQFADFTQLQQLPAVSLVTHFRANDDNGVKLTVTNPSSSPAVAFFVNARVVDRHSGTDVTPLFWTDNYFSLLPGESQQITTVLPATVSPGEVDVVVEVWNNIVGLGRTTRGKEQSIRQ